MRPASESPPIASSSRLKDAWEQGAGTRRLPSLGVIRDPSRRIRQAVRDNNVSLLDRLQHKYDLRNADKSRMTSLSWAAVEGNLEVFEWLLMDYGHDDQELSRDHENNSILHILASLPSPTAVFARNPVLPPCADHRPKTEVYETALKMAALYIYCFPFLNNWCNAAGKTPIHIAAQLGHTPMVQFLVDNEADVDLVDAQGNSPLHYASAYGHVETCKLLLEAGCASHVRNAEGFIASEFAFTGRVYVELESTAKAVAERRRARAPAGQALATTLAGPTTMRTRTGSASTSGSASQGRHGLGLSSGSPSLLERVQYFDASDMPPARPRIMTRRSNTPPPSISRRSSEGITSTQVTGNGNVPPVPPLPLFTQQPRPPSRSPSLPAQPAVRYPMVFLGTDAGGAGMQKANSNGASDVSTEGNARR